MTIYNPHDFYGYPEEIDALAIRLSKLAQKVHNGSDAITKAISAMDFEGPKASDIRQRSRERRRSAQHIAMRLQELSWTTFQAANLCRQKIYEHELAEQRARDALYPDL